MKVDLKKERNIDLFFYMWWLLATKIATRVRPKWVL